MRQGVGVSRQVRASGIAFLALAAAALTTLPSGAATFRVSPDGTGDHATIAAALAAAAQGDTVLLAPGTFSGDGNRDLDPAGKAVVIRSESGNPYTCVLDCGGSGANPHRAFLFRGGETAGMVISGILIRAGNVSANSAPMNYGGAIFCAADAGGRTVYPTIQHCVFDECAASLGGALYIGQDAFPEIIDCYFHGNRGQGGAIAVSANAAPIISGCIFEANEGAPPSILAGGSSTTSIEVSTILRNADGAIGGRGQAHLSLRYCTIAANSGPSAVITLSESAQADLMADILAFNGGPSVSCSPGTSVVVSCGDIVGNQGGDWIGCIAQQQASNGNISEDPRFCNAPEGDFRLDSHSPCLADGNQCETRMGSQDLGCAETAAERASWGRVRALFR